MGISPKLKDKIIEFGKKGTSVREIAAGVALGVFIAFIPMVGVHTAIALGVGYLLRLNPAVVFLGTQVSNPLSFPIITFISAETGNLILHGSPLDIKFTKDMSYLRHYVYPILAGSLALGAVASVVSYYLTMRILAGRPQSR